MVSSQNPPDIGILGDQPAHLQEASAKAAERITKQMDQKAEDKSAKAEAEEPKGQEAYTFELKYRDGRGKLWKGTFTNKAPTVRAQQTMALLQSEWQLGKPWESIDPDIAAMNSFLAHMAFTLTPHDDAKWACDTEGKLDLRNLHDTGIIQALWLEVASHEATFLGQRPVEERSEKGS